MKVVIKNVNEAHKIVDINNDLHTLQNIVEGYIEIPYIPSISEMGISMIINDEGKLNGSEPNIALIQGSTVADLVFGNVIFAGTDESDLTDLNEEQIEFLNKTLNLTCSQCIIQHKKDSVPKVINAIKIG